MCALSLVCFTLIKLLSCYTSIGISSSQRKFYFVIQRWTRARCGIRSRCIQRYLTSFVIHHPFLLLPLVTACYFPLFILYWTLYDCLPAFFCWQQEVSYFIVAFIGSSLTQPTRLELLCSFPRTHSLILFANLKLSYVRGSTFFCATNFNLVSLPSKRICNELSLDNLNELDCLKHWRLIF